MYITIFILNIIGTIAFAASGAIIAISKKFDIFGVVVLGVTTAVGGGFIRDIVLGNLPPVALRSPEFTLIAIITAILAFIPAIRRNLNTSNKLFDKIMFVMDTVGLSAFTMIGVTACFEQGQDSLFICSFVGIVTGVGGGVIRDVFSSEPPYIFKKHIYACASAAGSIITYFLYGFIGSIGATIIGFLTVFIIRCLSAHFKWNLPVAKDI